MEKAGLGLDVEKPKDTLSTGRVLMVLAGAIFTLAVAFIVIVSCGAWYIGHLQNECNTPKQKTPNAATSEYNVGVRNNTGVTKEHVVVDEEKETEFVIIRHPDTNHITYLLTNDYARDVTAIYHSETGMCYFVRMDGNTPAFADELETLRNNDGETVDQPELTQDYTVDESVTNQDDIPDEMKSFCNLQNSFWLEEGQAEQGERVKRGVWICRTYLVCSYYRCYYIRRCYYYSG